MKKIRTNDWTRREFTAQSVLALLSGVTVTLTGCGDGNSSSTPSTPTTPTSPPPAPGPESQGDVTGTVSANHGHRAVVTGAQITAGNAVTIDIRGTADHTHSLSLSADQVGRIADGERVQETTTINQAHGHTVTFN